LQENDKIYSTKKKKLIRKKCTFLYVILYRKTQGWFLEEIFDGRLIFRADSAAENKTEYFPAYLLLIILLYIYIYIVNFQ